MSNRKRRIVQDWTTHRNVLAVAAAVRAENGAPYGPHRNERFEIPPTVPQEAEPLTATEAWALRLGVELY